MVLLARCEATPDGFRLAETAVNPKAQCALKIYRSPVSADRAVQLPHALMRLSHKIWHLYIIVCSARGVKNCHLKNLRFLS
jgi:hypothetical protein